MTVFPLLAAPDEYRACPTDLALEKEKKAHWFGVFRRHIDELIQEGTRSVGLDGMSEEEAGRRFSQVRANFLKQLDEAEANIQSLAPLTILNICEWREQHLREAGIDDPYHHLKREENERAINLVTGVIESAPDFTADLTQEGFAFRLRGILAGNLFDVGATEVSKQSVEGIDYDETLRKLKPRPWRFDDLDAVSSRLAEDKYKHILIFVDNSGPDFVLGILPFVHSLLRLDSKPMITLTANTDPSLNDITYEEMQQFFRMLDVYSQEKGPLYSFCEGLNSGQLQLVPSGNGYPLIDLSNVSQELSDHVTRNPVDFCVLEGMGRSLESNWDAKLSCDCLRIAMIKDHGVAMTLDAELYDLVCRFEAV